MELHLFVQVVMIKRNNVIVKRLLFINIGKKISNREDYVAIFKL